jgi:hypothetical protein
MAEGAEAGDLAAVARTVVMSFIIWSRTRSGSRGLLDLRVSMW